MMQQIKDSTLQNYCIILLNVYVCKIWEVSVDAAVYGRITIKQPGCESHRVTSVKQKPRIRWLWG